MSIRTEISEDLAHQAQQGEIILSRTGREIAAIELQEVTRAYHNARKNMLGYDLPAAYGIAVWGSARIKPTSRHGRSVTGFVESFIEKNPHKPIRIVTGGGPGLMEAANYGVHRAREKTRTNGSGTQLIVVNYGVPVNGLPTQEKPNRFIDNKNGEEEHPEFSTRKQRMQDLINGAYIVMGGWGTLYEAFMTLQNEQTGHTKGNLIVANVFWKDTLDKLNDLLYHERVRGKYTPLISEKDLGLVQFVKRPEEAVEIFSAGLNNWWETTGKAVRWVE